MKKRILAILLILCLLLTAGCRPATEEEEIEGNPAAGRQPTAIQPSDEPVEDQPNVPGNEPLPDNENDPVLSPTPLSKNAADLTKDIPIMEIGYVMEAQFPAAAADFALRLMQNSAKDGENLLLSPYSVMQALGMTAVGAKGNTYVEMEQTLLGKNDLSLHHNLAATLQSGNVDGLHVANSVWLRNSGLTANKDYLQQVANYYHAQVYSAPFDDGTVKDINQWCSNNTNGMIPVILDKIPDPMTMVYLINAVSLKAQWADIFAFQNIEEGTFTAANGQKEKAQMMKHIESDYLENELATGFIKRYKGGLSFVALLPKEGTPEQLLSGLNGENWLPLLTPQANSRVHITLPKFEVEFADSLKGPLQAMGIRDVFDANQADLSAMGKSALGNLYVSEVLHKAVIKVNEKGTEASAITSAALSGTATAPSEPPKEYTVTLDRPFVYAVVDLNNVPLFMGVLNSVA